MRSIAVVALAAGVAGCGLDMGGLAAVGAGRDASATDGGMASEGGAALEGDADGGAPEEETGASTDGGSCVAGLPAGWSLVVYEANRGPCPPGYGGGHDGVSGATAGPGACSCTCTLTAQPACDHGTVATQWAAQAPPPGPGPCASPGTPLQPNGSGCTAFPVATQLSGAFSGEPFAPTGGSCTAAVSADPSKVSKGAVRTCDVPTSDSESVCLGSAPAGFSACISTSGDLPCPGGPFSQRWLVDDDLELVCPACALCIVTGTCANAQVKFYSDQGCGTLVATFACDGSCQGAGSGANQTVAAYEYTAQPKGSCVVAPAGPPKFTPVTPRTLCCR
jgi:hypothetical protein